MADIPAMHQGTKLSILFALISIDLAQFMFCCKKVLYLAISIAPALQGVVQINDGAAGLPG